MDTNQIYKNIIDRITGPHDGFSMPFYEVIYDQELKRLVGPRVGQMTWGRHYICINEDEYRQLSPSVGDEITVELDCGELKRVETPKGTITRTAGNTEELVS